MTNMICSFIDFIIELIAFVLPDISIPDEIISAINLGSDSVAELLRNVNFIIPVPLIFKVIVFMMTFRFGTTVLWCINWVINKIFDVIP